MGIQEFIFKTSMKINHQKLRLQEKNTNLGKLALESIKKQMVIKGKVTKTYINKIEQLGRERTETRRYLEDNSITRFNNVFNRKKSTFF
jgi:hypothetical protein